MTLGQEPPPLLPQEFRDFDSDNDKVFYNFESTTAAAPPKDRLVVIHQFNEDLDRVDFSGLRQAAGPFPIPHRFCSIHVVFTSLTGIGLKLPGHQDFTSKRHYALDVLVGTPAPVVAISPFTDGVTPFGVGPTGGSRRHDVLRHRRY